MSLQDIGARLVLDGLGPFLSGVGSAQGKTDDLGGSLKGLPARSDAASKSLGFLGHTASSALGTLAADVVRNFTAALASVPATAIDFQATMSGVKAVSAATGDEMKQLSDLSLQLGKDTSFTATQAAKGIEELVKGGVAINDVIGGAAVASLNLAAAGEISVAEAAEIAANAMNQFGLKGADMAHVTDLIAGAANASSMSVGDFRLALGQAGAVAAVSGLSFDDTAEAIAVLGAQGIRSSDAGTSLKQMLLNLQPATKAAQKAFAELGLTTADGGNAFFDASGKAKSMRDIAAVLSKSLAGLTDQQRLAKLEIMFGSDAMRASAVFAKAGAEGFDTMADAMGKVTAAGVAAERLDNVKGSVEQLTGSLETASIKFMDRFMPAINDSVKAATGFVNDGLIPAIESLDTLQSTSDTVSIAVSIAIGVIATAAIAALPAVIALAGGFVALAIAAAPFLAVAGSIAGAAYFLKTSFDSVSEAQAKQRQEVAELTDEYDRLSKTLDELPGEDTGALGPGMLTPGVNWRGGVGDTQYGPEPPDWEEFVPPPPVREPLPDIFKPWSGGAEKAKKGAKELKEEVVELEDVLARMSTGQLAEFTRNTVLADAAFELFSNDMRALLREGDIATVTEQLQAIGFTGKETFEFIRGVFSDFRAEEKAAVKEAEEIIKASAERMADSLTASLGADGSGSALERINKGLDEWKKAEWISTMEVTISKVSSDIQDALRAGLDPSDIIAGALPLFDAYAEATKGIAEDLSGLANAHFEAGKQAEYMGAMQRAAAQSYMEDLKKQIDEIERVNRVEEELEAARKNNEMNAEDRAKAAAVRRRQESDDALTRQIASIENIKPELDAVKALVDSAEFRAFLGQAGPTQNELFDLILNSAEGIGLSGFVRGPGAGLSEEAQAVFLAGQEAFNRLLFELSGTLGFTLEEIREYARQVLENEDNFAFGGSFRVGGRGGVDSSRVRFNATPGEEVTVTRPRPDMVMLPVSAIMGERAVDRSTSYVVNASYGREQSEGDIRLDLEALAMMAST